jgi:D-sedoheptulose 7-phosphate isomerase
LGQALDVLERDLDRIERWGITIADALDRGGRVLTVGNGGSAAQAQHLSAELVGRYVDERRPLSAIALHTDTSALTAIINDYGPDEAFARPVRAHGRAGDVLVALSTSGRSGNVLAAVKAAKERDLLVYALTGRVPNPLAFAADDALFVEAETPTIQEVHQVAIHLLCEAIDEHVLGHQHDGAVGESVVT